MPTQWWWWWLLTLLLLSGLLEERALLLGRMGKHEQALFIYVHILKDTKMAEEYVHPATAPPSECDSRPHRERRGGRGSESLLPPLCLPCWPPIVAPS